MPKAKYYYHSQGDPIIYKGEWEQVKSVAPNSSLPDGCVPCGQLEKAKNYNSKHPNPELMNAISELEKLHGYRVSQSLVNREFYRSILFVDCTNVQPRDKSDHPKNMTYKSLIESDDFKAIDPGATYLKCSLLDENLSKQEIDHIIENNYSEVLATVSSDANGETLLHECVTKGYQDSVENLLRKAPDAVNARDNYGETALHKAIRMNYLAIAEILLKHDYLGFKNDQNIQGVTALHLACQRAHIPSVQLLMKYRVDHELRTVPPNSVQAVELIPKNTRLDTIDALHSYIPSFTYNRITVYKQPMGRDTENCQQYGHKIVDLKFGNRPPMTSIKHQFWQHYSNDSAVQACFKRYKPHKIELKEGLSLRHIKSVNAIKEDISKKYINSDLRSRGQITHIKEIIEEYKQGIYNPDNIFIGDTKENEALNKLQQKVNNLSGELTKDDFPCAIDMTKIMYEDELAKVCGVLQRDPRFKMYIKNDQDLQQAPILTLRGLGDLKGLKQKLKIDNPVYASQVPAIMQVEPSTMKGAKRHISHNRNLMFKQNAENDLPVARPSKIARGSIT